MKQQDEKPQSLVSSKRSTVPGSNEDLADIAAVDFDTPDSAAVNPGANVNNQADFPAGSKQRTAPWWYSQFNLMFATFGLLAVAALLFVMLVPSPEINEQAIRQAAQVNTELEISDSETPWVQSQRAETRSDSQSILQNLLTNKKKLENKGVLVWAPERYQQALDMAAQGDEFYKQQNFESAIAAYQSSSDKMESLYQFLPNLIATQLAEGEAAIRAGKASLAEQKFNAVMKLDSGNLAASLGLNRAMKLNEVLALIRGADGDESDFLKSGNIEDLLASEQKLEEAKAIDGLFKLTNQSLQRVHLAIVDKRFNLAMTDAYQALFAYQYGAARKAFAEALRIKPGDSSAASALQQSLAADKTTSMKSLLANARAFEKSEEWASAKSNYQTVLQRDSSQVGAKLGVIRSGARQQLDEQIRLVLGDTLAFSRDQKNNQASSLLADARAIKTKGTLLSQQIAQLETALALADRSVKISLLSDNFTDVSLQRTGSRAIKFGSFVKKNLSLKPGRYVVTGVRLGYRDVRTQIELHVQGEAAQSFTIVCDEPLRTSAVISSDRG